MLNLNVSGAFNPLESSVYADLPAGFPAKGLDSGTWKQSQTRNTLAFLALLVAGTRVWKEAALGCVRVDKLVFGHILKGQDLKIPLSVQGHHALMDGIHMAKFYARVEGYLQHPEDVVNER